MLFTVAVSNIRIQVQIIVNKAANGGNQPIKLPATVPTETASTTFLATSMLSSAIGLFNARHVIFDGCLLFEF